MSTWVQTCAPNLLGYPSWEFSSCSHAMHAAHPWNVTLMGRISSNGSLLVSRQNTSSTPYAWAPRDPGFSLIGNWCVVWDPPLVAQLCCLSHRCLTPLHCEDTSTHPGDQSLTTLRCLGACALRDTDPCHSWDPPYVGPPLLVVKRRSRIGRYLLWPSPPPRPVAPSSPQPCRCRQLRGQGAHQSQVPSVPWPCPCRPPSLPLVRNPRGYAEGQQEARVQVGFAHHQVRSHYHLQERVGHEVRRHLAGPP